MISLKSLLHAILRAGTKRNTKRDITREPLNLSDVPLPVSIEDGSTVMQWIASLDALKAILVVQKKAIENSAEGFESKSEWLRSIAALTKHLARLKDHWLNFKYRSEQFRTFPECYEKSEFEQAKSLSIEIYELILKLTVIFEHYPLNRFKAKQLQPLLETLFHDVEKMANQMVSLNRFAYRQEALMQIAELERSLLCSLIKNELMVVSDPDDTQNTSMQFSVKNDQPEWIFKLNRINDSEHVALIQNMFEIYQMLSNCYVTTRRSVVNATLDDMNQSLEALTACFFQNQINQKQVLLHMRSIYNQIESLRFSANRDSRCSRNLLERSKDARKIFLHACQQNSVAREFLSSLVSPVKVFKIKR